MAALGEQRGHEVPDGARRVEAMVARHGAALLRVANQFSLCHDDALDAYQRGLEIYLRRLDTVDRATEGAWLRVVVKHEAMAIRRARQESVERADVDLDDSVHAGLREVDDVVAGEERVDRSVEALRALKPDEARALLLKAEGLSYQEIGKRFGWSYTKVNRSITEGRKRFMNVFGEIESGEACGTYADVLSALAGGTATSAQVVSIRPHLRHCAACRATVREMRFSRAKRLALFGPFAWLARLLTRPEVFAVSSGGGRLGPAAAAIGLCLSGVGAATCVVTGALPAPPIVSVVDEKPKAERPKKPKRAERKQPRRSATPTATAVATVASQRSTPAPTAAKPKPRPTRRKPATTTAKRKPRAKTAQEFGFEDAAPSSAPASAPVTASAARAGTTEGQSRPRTNSTAKTPTGGEFGFEGG
ncbi:MAG TPA: sigma-70 family RNA polymerase sigma factor [Solirubrobacter sp.]|nr:sigma-70 family RNA polymerase sigma factor [Solirubrobacter sp.]